MNEAPDDRNLADVLNLEGLSRRRFLLGTLLSPSVLPLLGAAAALQDLADQSTKRWVMAPIA